MPVPWHQTDSGTILVDALLEDQPRTVALYARVSRHGQRRSSLRRLPFRPDPTSATHSTTCKLLSAA
jgi:hypothetical protein